MVNFRVEINGFDVIICSGLRLLHEHKVRRSFADASHVAPLTSVRFLLMRRSLGTIDRKGDIDSPIYF